jgi:hypothetical protein
MLRIMGISDDVTTCECCGRSELRKTVALGDENGGIKYYGCDCAAKAIARSGGRKMNGSTVEKFAVNASKPKAAKAVYAVINEKTGNAITKCYTMAEAEKAATIRGSGYFAAYTG